MCLADANTNPRPSRLIKLLNDASYTVDLLAFPSPSNITPVRTHYIIPQSSTAPLIQIALYSLNFVTRILLWLRIRNLAKTCYEIRSSLGKIDSLIPGNSYDVVVVEDFQLLPFAFRKFGNSPNTKIVCDAREFYPKQKETEFLFRMFERPIRNQICHDYLHQCDHLVTVSPGLADAYLLDFGVKMDVLRSTPHYQNLRPKPTKDNEIRMVHHGLARPNRKLSALIEITTRLDDRFTLDLYLTGNEKHIKNLKKLAEKCQRIRFVKPVPLHEIIGTLNNYDVGLCYFESSGFNLLFSLPNKFFEFVQARLAIVIGPSPDMAEIIESYKIGFVSKEFTVEAMVETLSALSKENIDHAKNNCESAANDLCYEKEGEKFLNRLNSLP